VEYYTWVKALHIISIVCWFAALFYLPRLFVYHAMTDDQTGRERFKIMERKLYRGIMMPSMIATFISGFWLLHMLPGWLSQGWLHAKLVLVVLLTGYHFYCGYIRLRFARDENTKSHIYYRWFNEMPTVALLGIVILAVVKPF
jgi:putative membrane protein